MRILKEAILNENVQYAKVLIGGSIGERALRSIRDLKNQPINREQIFDSKEEAKESAKRSNKNLSPGEKSYYGLKWVVAEVVDGVFTGN